MELKLNVSKVLLLDMPFKAEMLNDNQAVIGEIKGESVMFAKVNVDEITDQAKKKAMKYFEINDPYYALIKAEDAGEAVNKYIEVVAGEPEESQDFEEELQEVTRDYALIKFSRAPGEDGKMVDMTEIMMDFNNGKSEVLIIDGSLT